MIKWEYKFEQIEYDSYAYLIGIMDMRGDDGWELISHGEILIPIDRTGESKSVNIKVLWKRRK